MATARVAVELDARQAGEVAQAAGDRRLMLGRAHHRRDRLVAVGGLAAAEIDHAVGREGVAVIAVAAGVGGGRMAGDQMIDRERVLDRAQAVLQRAVFAACSCILSSPPIDPA